MYVGIKHHVIAIDRATGTELWRVKLQGMRMRAHDFVGLHLDGDDLFATCNGELFCLDPAAGAVRWHNQLTGLGTGVVSILTPPDAPDRSAEQSPSMTVAEELHRRAQQRQAAAAT